MATRTYSIREVFDTLQGEGARAGRRSVFVRFAGCNLWDGRPAHRLQGKGACAKWCDTDFAHGEALTVKELLERMNTAWKDAVGGQHTRRWCVLTGGEPCLQLDSALVTALHEDGWKIAVETNGTVNNPALEEVDFVTLSAKLGTEVIVEVANEVKLVLPGVAPGTGEGWTDDAIKTMCARFLNAAHYVQPQDPVDIGTVEVTWLKPQNATSRPLAMEEQWRRNVARCVSFVKANPDWALSLQTHKFIKLP